MGTVKLSLVVLCALGLFGWTELLSQESILPDFPEGMSPIVPIALIHSNDPISGPGIWFRNEQIQDPLSVQWKMIDTDRQIPAAFRESEAAFFYFPPEGDFLVELNWIDQSGREFSEKLFVLVEADKTTFYSQTGLHMEQGYVVLREEYRSSPDVWDHLELTGIRSKPLSIGNIPWYAPASALAAGGALWLLIDSDEDPDPPDPIPDLVANDLSVEIQCPEGVEINPLINDLGDGLSVTEVTGLSPGVGSFQPPDRIIIQPGLVESITFSYTVADIHGQTGTAGIEIIVGFPPFSLSEIQEEVQAGESISGNVFESAQCTDCELLSFGQAVSGSVHIDQDGNFQYQSEEQFGGWVEIPFQATDACGQYGDSQIRIWVEAICEAEWEVYSTPADCGLENGEANVVILNEGDFSINWEDGSGDFERTSLASRTYDFTVMDNVNDCSYEGIAEVKELQPDHWSFASAETGNCLESPNASLGFGHDGPGPLILQVTGPGEDLTTGIQDWSQATSLTELWPDVFFSGGVYSLSVYDEAAGEGCASTREITLEELPLPMELNDLEVSTHQGSSVGGNLLSNDQGTGLQYVSIEQPGTGNIEVDASGKFNFNAAEDQIGEITLEYTARDSCGQEKTAFLIIQVLPCEISADFDAGNPDCGLDNGFIQVAIDNPENYTFLWSTGADSASIQSLGEGTYSLTITESTTECEEILEVDLVTKPPMAHNDSFKISVEDTLSANLLVNDEGQLLTVLEFESVEEGDLEIDSTGEMTFIPDGQFTGIVRFFYVVQDSCSGVDTAEVVIEITPEECEYEYQITVDTADCGLANGAVYIELETECDYEIQWHDGSSGDSLTKQSAGEYEFLLILSGEGFEEDTITLTYTIPENPPIYIEAHNTENPDCLTEGEIELILSSPGQSNFEIEVQGPDGTTVFETTDLEVMLSEFVQLTAGDYRIAVKDLSLDCEGADSLRVTLEEIPLPLEARDREIQVFSGEEITFNVLDNDVGTGLKVTGHGQANFGELIIDANGKGTFVSTIPEHGTLEILYTIQDSCGTEAEALLTIEVELPPCDFEVEFTPVKPDCGYSNGSLMAEVIPSGNYEFNWSNGAKGSVVENLAAGSYELTVTDLLLQCDLVFSTTLEELEPNWVVNYYFFSEGCVDGPEILLDLQSPHGNPIRFTVNGPGIINSSFYVEQGELLLSDFYGYLEADLYIINVLPDGSNSSCTQTIQDELHSAGPPALLSVLNTTNPGGPGQSNGVIEVGIQGGTAPYDLYLNGQFHGTTSQMTYNFENLSAGTYEIQVFDALNCATEILEVTLATGSSILSMKIGKSFAGGHEPTVDWTQRGMETPWGAEEEVSSSYLPQFSWSVELLFRGRNNSIVGLRSSFEYHAGKRIFSRDNHHSHFNFQHGRASLGPALVLPTPIAVVQPSVGIGYQWQREATLGYGAQGGFSDHWTMSTPDWDVSIDFSREILNNGEVYAGYRLVADWAGKRNRGAFRAGVNWKF